MAKALVIIAGGCSLTEEDIAHVKANRHKCDVMVVNNGYMLAPWAEYLYYCDDQFFRWHKDGIKNFKGIVATLSDDGFCHWRFNRGYERGLSHHPHVLNTGKNSGYQALNLGLLLGYKNIYLLGYDMKRGKGDKTHWFGDHPVPSKNLFDKFLECYDSLYKALHHWECRIINCSRDTDLRVFPLKTIQEVLIP